MFSANKVSKVMYKIGFVVVRRQFVDENTQVGVVVYSGWHTLLDTAWQDTNNKYGYVFLGNGMSNAISLLFCIWC